MNSDNGKTKSIKAKEMGIKIISEDILIEMVNNEKNRREY